jgi:hypothetical protein
MMRALLLSLACSALLAGCSSLKTYQGSGEKNMLVRVKNEGGGFFSSTRPDVHIFSVDAACQAQYLGTVELDQPKVEIGLPLGQTVLIEFVFSKSTFGGRAAATAVEVMATPRKGTRYEFDVAYLRNGYTATGVEFQPGQGKGREMEYRRLRDCVAAKKKA